MCLGTFGVVVYPSLCLLWWLFPQSWLSLMSFSQDETASSTFQVPVWSLGTQPETKVSWEVLKSKYPLIFEAFSADDSLLLAMDREILKNRNKDLMLSGDVSTFEWRQTFCSNLKAKEIGILKIRRGHWILGMSWCCKIQSFWVPLKWDLSMTLSPAKSQCHVMKR